jgi:hypothetical protein
MDVGVVAAAAAKRPPSGIFAAADPRERIRGLRT